MSCDAAAAADGVGAGVADFNIFLTTRWVWHVVGVVTCHGFIFSKVE
jgi:hypothetical protein